MKYVSVDIETTGLDADRCQIIEFGAVIDEINDHNRADPGLLKPVESLPSCHFYVSSPTYRGEPYALSMHPEIFRRIATHEEGFVYVPEDCLARCFADWLESNGFEANLDDPIVFTAAGKNFSSFDNNFLNKLPGWGQIVKAHHRVIDPAMFFWRPFTDTGIPNSQTCMERAGIEGEVDHTALEDAKMVVELVREGIKNINPS